MQLGLLFIVHFNHKCLLFIYCELTVSKVLKQVWISVIVWWVLNRIKELYNYGRSRIESVDTLLFCAGAYCTMDRTWLRLRTCGKAYTVLWTSLVKKLMNKNDFVSFLSRFLFLFPFTFSLNSTYQNFHGKALSDVFAVKLSLLVH